MIHLRVMILLVAATDFDCPPPLQRYALSPKVRLQIKSGISGAKVGSRSNLLIYFRALEKICREGRNYYLISHMIIQYENIIFIWWKLF